MEQDLTLQTAQEIITAQREQITYLETSLEKGRETLKVAFERLVQLEGQAGETVDIKLYRIALRWAAQLVMHLEECDACGQGKFCSAGGFIAKESFTRAMLAIKKGEEVKR